MRVSLILPASALILLAVSYSTNAGGFPSLATPFPMGALMRQHPFLKPGMTDDEMFDVFFSDTSYLLKPEELLEDDDEEDDDDEEIEGRGLVNLDEYDEYEDEEEETEVMTRINIAGGAKFVIKQIGKVGLNLLKKGLRFLKSTFYKFGGKRLLKRAKKYLKEDAFTLERLNCEKAACRSCAVFKLPFKVKEFKACAELSVKRDRGKTNFTMDFNIVKKSLFSKDFQVGDIANCFGFDSDPNGEAGMAALIGKVCVQGFQLKVEKNKTGKFCLAVVFKRWATGFRFCAKRMMKPKPKDDKDDEGKKNQTRVTGKLRVKKQKVTHKQRNHKHESKSKMVDKNNKKWKVELKRISAGEQDNQLVSDKSLFKGEGNKRREDSAALLD